MSGKKRRQERWVFRVAECEGPFFLLALGKAYEIHHVCNISSSGMAIEMPAGFPVGEKIIVTYETKDMMLSVKGEIRWCKEEHDKEGVYRFGIEFDSNNQKSRSLLLRSIESYRAPFANNIFREKRSHERRKFRTATCEGPFFLIASGKTYEISAVFDISTGGIGIEMPRSFNVGDKVVLVYETRDLLHHVKGDIAWCAQNSENESYRFGVVFAPGDEKKKNLLLFSLKSYYESVSKNIAADRVEKRSHKRQEYFFTECKPGFVLELDGKDYQISSVRNISVSGMEIEMPSHSFEVGASVKIIHIDSDDKVAVNGTIVWVQCLLDSSYCRFGVKFSEENPHLNKSLYIALRNSLDAVNTPPDGMAS